MRLEKYSLGIGDRFGRQGRAQLRALLKAAGDGIDIVPVWNKSYREHAIVNTSPVNVREEADDAVRALGWRKNYYVDADHISLEMVEHFIAPSDFFTMDVAGYIGRPAGDKDMYGFVGKNRKYMGTLFLPAAERQFEITEEMIIRTGRKYLHAVREAGRIYRYICSRKGADNFITEISMDETGEPQTPVEMFFILSAVADEKIPVQAIAPKFTGRFNKGVDYTGDTERFHREFEDDLAVLAYAVEEFGLPGNLKLSIHSGSDKFSIYGPVREAIKKFNAGLHLKTAGTTWLEELTGLAMAGGEGLKTATEIYRKTLAGFDELCGPYKAVIDIDRDALPTAETVDGWSGREYASALVHDVSCGSYNPHFRQALHVGYRVAAEMGQDYLDVLEEFKDIIARNVTENLYERHIRRLFV